MVIAILRVLSFFIYSYSQFYLTFSKKVDTTMSVRLATLKDLPKIQSLIKFSFAAMNDEYPPDENLRNMWEKSTAQLQQKGDISDGEFATTYNISPRQKMWMIDIDNRGVGCVGLKCLSRDDAELVRMAVDPDIRGRGVGSQLIENLTSYASKLGIQRIHLVTANPRSALFYGKHGFVTTKLWTPQIPNVPFPIQVKKMTLFLSEKIIRKVAIVGGTHGNERVGLELVRQWNANPQSVTRPSFQTLLVVGNPAAAECNRRFVNADLNRQCSGELLSKHISEPPREDELEACRAQELNKLLGPKYITTLSTLATPAAAVAAPAAVDGAESLGPPAAVDFTIDLHSSNSHTGLMCMVAGADTDYYAMRVAQHVQECVPEMRITHSGSSKESTTSVDSLSASGFAFEVGPLPHGTISAATLENTRKLVTATLDFIDDRNKRLLEAAALVSLSSPEEGVAQGEGGSETGSEGGSALTVRGCDGSTEGPCLSPVIEIDGRQLVQAWVAPHLIKRTVFSVVERYAFVSRIMYPTVSPSALSTILVSDTSVAPSPDVQDDSTATGGAALTVGAEGAAVTDAIVQQRLQRAADGVMLETDSATSTILQSLRPQPYLIHPALEGRDWTPLKEGDPVFVLSTCEREEERAGAAEVRLTKEMVAEGAPPGAPAPAPGTEYCPVFINEAAYQPNGNAFVLYKKEDWIVV